MIKIAKSLAVIAFVAAIAIGATSSYFSDTETSTGNTVAAGELDLDVNGQNPLSGPVVTIADMKPSQVRYSNPVVLHITNNPGRLYKHIKLPTGQPQPCETVTVTEPECTEQGGTYVNGQCTGMTADNNDLLSWTWFDLKVGVYKVDNAGNETLLGEGVFIADPGTGQDGMLIPVSSQIYLGTYKPSRKVKVVQSFHLKPDVTNWAQSDKCTFDEEFMVQQTNAPHPDTVLIPSGLKELDCEDALDNDDDGLIDLNDSDCLPS